MNAHVPSGPESPGALTRRFEGRFVQDKKLIMSKEDDGKWSIVLCPVFFAPALAAPLARERRDIKDAPTYG